MKAARTAVGCRPMKVSLLPTLLLAGCASASQMAQKPPARVYHSPKARSVIVECLLNRVTSADLHAVRTEAEGATTIAFTSAGAMIKPQPTVLLFTVRDEGSGSSTEAWRLGNVSLAAAETCF